MKQKLSAVVSATVSPKLHERILATAALEERSLSNVVRSALNKAFPALPNDKRP